MTATDGSETIGHVLQVSVGTLPEPPVPPENGVPVIGAVQDKTAMVNGTFTLALTSSDPDAWDSVNLTFKLVSGPEGLVVSAEGVVLWLPAHDQVGEHEVVVSLGDTKDATTRSFNVVVEAVDGDGDGVEPTTEGNGDWLVVALAIVIVVLVVLMLWMYMGHR